MVSVVVSGYASVEVMFVGRCTLLVACAELYSEGLRALGDG